MLALLLLQQVASAIVVAVQTECSRRISRRAQLEYFGLLSAVDTLEKLESGAAQSEIRVANDSMERVPAQTLMLIGTFLRSIFSAIGFFSAISTVSIATATIALFSIVPLVAVDFHIGRSRLESSIEVVPHYRVSSYFSGILGSIDYAKDLRVFGLFAYFAAKYDSSLNKLNRVSRRQSKLELMASIGSAVIAVGFAGFAIAVGVFSSAGYDASAQNMVLIVSSITGISTAGLGIGGPILRFRENMTLLGRSASVLNQLKRKPQELEHQEPLLTKSISFENVSFRYSVEGNWVVRNATFEIVANRKTVLVGPNGAGKSTILKLAAGLYRPTSGRVKWDGVDISDLEPETVRKMISALFQEIPRYGLTLQENVELSIVCGNPRTTVEEAIDVVGLTEFVRDLPARQETMLTPWLYHTGGMDLSGGQWQRVALARILLRHASLYIFDEPTSMLDIETSDKVSRYISSKLGNATILASSHSKDVIDLFEDQLLVTNGTVIPLSTRKSDFATLPLF
jgi:ATP-binding cassette subfamily B protein